MRVASLPTLVVVSGPAGSGKTTLAHAIARADPAPGDAAERVRAHNAFERVRIDAPWTEVDTTDGYRPALSEIVAFVNGPR